jgi:hypothetical protein
MHHLLSLEIALYFTEAENIVVRRHVARQRQRNKQQYNSRRQITALQTTAVARQWLSSDHVGTQTDTNATISQQQRKGVFCAVRSEML